MTATNDPLARVQAMVSAWGETEPFRHFRHHHSRGVTTEPRGNLRLSTLSTVSTPGIGACKHKRSAHAYRPEAQEQESASRVVSYSSGVESVESVENDRKDSKDSDLIFDTSCLQVSKNGRRVSKTGRSAAPEAPTSGICAPAGVPPEWVRGVARLPELRCPARFPAAKWPQVVIDAAAFLEGWAAQAAALGWSAWELFGCHRHAPWGRIQGMGLVLPLQGDQIAALTATEAVIRTRTGAHQTYRRRPADPLHPAERCFVWELSDE